MWSLFAEIKRNEHCYGRGCTSRYLDMICVLGHKYCGRCPEDYDDRCVECNHLIFKIHPDHEEVFCQNRAYGCDFSGPSSECIFHRNYCDYLPFKCPFETRMDICVWSESVKDARDHFEKFHPNFFNKVNLLQPFKQVLPNIRQLCNKDPKAVSQWKDRLLVLSTEQDNFILKIEYLQPKKIRWCLEHFAIRTVQGRKGFTFLVSFKKPGADNTFRMADYCGVPNDLWLENAEEFCDKEGNLLYELYIHDGFSIGTRVFMGY